MDTPREPVVMPDDNVATSPIITELVPETDAAEVDSKSDKMEPIPNVEETESKVVNETGLSLAMPPTAATGPSESTANQEMEENVVQIEEKESVPDEIVPELREMSVDPCPTTNSDSLAADQLLDVSQTKAVLTSSLALLADYGLTSDSESSSSESSSSSSSSSEEDDVKVIDMVGYRNTATVSSGGSEAEGSDEEGDEVSERDRKTSESRARANQRKLIKTKGELDVCDLPPIEDLNISVPEHECQELGHVSSIVDQLALVESKRFGMALDLDTVLFLDHGHRTLGRIFDVLGQINQPIYCVRFNSAAQIREKGITVGQKVFYNSKRPEHTSVVVVANLMRNKGSDASWEHDVEPPEGCLDYSDDEQERSTRKARRGHKPVPEDARRSKRPLNQQQQQPPRRAENNPRRIRNPFFGQPRNQHYLQSTPSQDPQNHYHNQRDHSWHTYYNQGANSSFAANPYAHGGPSHMMQFTQPPPSLPYYPPPAPGPYPPPGPGPYNPNVKREHH